jgi:hypothetical protein
MGGGDVPTLTAEGVGAIPFSVFKINDYFYLFRFALGNQKHTYM